VDEQSRDRAAPLRRNPLTVPHDPSK